jgi:hypothetical protein
MGAKACKINNVHMNQAGCTELGTNSRGKRQDFAADHSTLSPLPRSHGPRNRQVRLVIARMRDGRLQATPVSAIRAS